MAKESHVCDKILLIEEDSLKQQLEQAVSNWGLI